MPPLAHLGIAKLELEHSEGMFDLGADTSFDFFMQVNQGV